MKFVLIYETNPANLPLARTHFPAHRARIDEFHARGTLLMVGPYENPLDGALGIFTTREAAEEFVREDPFMINGVVRNPRILGWKEILSVH